MNKNQVASIPVSLSRCPRLKVLRLEENCLALAAITPQLLKESQISLLAVEGNLFDAKQLREADGYDQVFHNQLKTMSTSCIGLQCVWSAAYLFVPILLLSHMYYNYNYVKQLPVDCSLYQSRGGTCSWLPRVRLILPWGLSIIHCTWSIKGCQTGDGERRSVSFVSSRHVGDWVSSSTLTSWCVYECLWHHHFRTSACLCCLRVIATHHEPSHRLVTHYRSGVLDIYADHDRTQVDLYSLHYSWNRFMNLS